MTETGLPNIYRTDELVGGARDESDAGPAYRLLFHAVPSYLLADFIGEVEQRGCWVKVSEGFGRWRYCRSVEPPPVSVPDDVRLTSPLPSSWSPIVAASWEYATPASSYLIQRRLALSLSVAACTKAESAVVGWILTRVDGSIGYLRVDESMRGKGIGQALVSAAVTEMMRARTAADEATSSSVTHCYISLSNGASQRLHERVGFEREGSEDGTVFHWVRVGWDDEQQEK